MLSHMFFGIDLTQIIEVLGYPGIFAIVLAESGLFFGVSLPGGSLLFTAGLLASQGFLNIYILVTVVITAAILGDSIGYWFGAWVGPALWRRKDGRFYKKAYLEQTRIFFDKHGSRTIFLARFIPIVRTFAPILAGVAQMDYRTFFFYNMLGAFLWGGGFVVGGYLLGETIPGIEDYLEYFILGIIFVTMIPFILHLRSARKAQPSAKPENAKAIIFDLDDTLADSFSPPTEDMLSRVLELAQHVPIAIMSGASIDRVKKDVMDRISPRNDAKAVYAFSDSAANGHMWDKGQWREVFTYPLSDQERIAIAATIKETLGETALYENEKDTSRILERPTSIAFTALWKDATQLEKRAWDSDGTKREKLLQALRKKLPEYEINIGGKTTLDVTRSGINKAHGVVWLAKDLGLEPKDMLFIGDAFYEGGNDLIVVPTGIQTLPTSGPKETRRMIDDLLQKFS